MAVPDDRESDLRLGEYHILVLPSLFDVVLFYTILLMYDRFLAAQRYTVYCTDLYRVDAVYESVAMQVVLNFV